MARIERLQSKDRQYKLESVGHYAVCLSCFLVATYLLSLICGYVLEVSLDKLGRYIDNLLFKRIYALYFVGMVFFPLVLLAIAILFMTLWLFFFSTFYVFRALEAAAFRMGFAWPLSAVISSGISAAFWAFVMLGLAVYQYDISDAEMDSLILVSACAVLAALMVGQFVYVA